ncbi:MAG TPA: glycosyltransferase family 39 protein, partial [Chloroflexota bacterium]|nr:glycosyltransferase family 39 protein [Chloroflexota bacterium]
VLRSPRAMFNTRSAKLALLLLAASSVSGGLAIAVTVAGRASLTSPSLRWWGIFAAAALSLALWGLLYARFLNSRGRAPLAASLGVAAACHLPLLSGLGLVALLYGNDLANHAYHTSAYGQLVYRPMVLAAVVAVPATLQLAAITWYWRAWVASHAGVLGAIGLAFGLRLWGSDWQLPYLFHNDERTYINLAMIAWAHGDPNPHHFTNPSLIFYLDTALFNLLGGSRSEDFRVFAEALGISIWDPRGLYLVALATRTVMALLSGGTVILAYLAGRDLLGRKIGQLAPWFLAASFLHVRNSHYGTNDVMATFFAMASFLFAVRVYRQGRWSDYLWAGAIGGIATSAKYNAGLFVLPLLAAHVLRVLETGSPFSLSRWKPAPLVAAYAISLGAFILGTPYSLLDWPAFWADFRRQVGYGAVVWFGQQQVPSWWAYTTGLIQGFGLMPLLLALAGIPALVRSKRRELAILLAFPLGYYAFMSGQQLYFARFAIPMLPFLAILSAAGAVWLWGLANRGRTNPLLATALMALVIVQPLLLTVQGNVVITREDTRVLADRWLWANAPQDAVVYLDSISDIRISQGFGMRGDMRLEWYDPRKDAPPWETDPQRPMFLVTSSYGYEGLRRGVGDLSVLPEEYWWFGKAAQIVASFNEGRGGGRAGYSQDDSYTPFWYVMDRERNGPSVQIIRID